MKSIKRRVNIMRYRITKKGQVSLELTFAIIVAMIFIVAIARVFVWFNERLVQRQQLYDATRKTQDGKPPDYNFDRNAPKLRIFE